jgi:hypothetical protein
VSGPEWDFAKLGGPTRERATFDGDPPSFFEPPMMSILLFDYLRENILEQSIVSHSKRMCIVAKSQIEMVYKMRLERVNK